MYSCKSLRCSGIAGLILGLASVVGCGGGESLPPTGDAEVFRPGPATPSGVLKQGAAGNKGRAKAETSKATPTPPSKGGQTQNAPSLERESRLLFSSRQAIPAGRSASRPGTHQSLPGCRRFFLQFAERSRRLSDLL
jgi:hypothetical protein